MIEGPATYLYNLAPIFFNIMFSFCCILLIIALFLIISPIIKILGKYIYTLYILKNLKNASKECLELYFKKIISYIETCTSAKEYTYYEKVLFKLGDAYESTVSTS